MLRMGWQRFVHGHSARGQASNVPEVLRSISYSGPAIYSSHCYSQSAPHWPGPAPCWGNLTAPQAPIWTLRLCFRASLTTRCVMSVESCLAVTFAQSKRVEQLLLVRIHLHGRLEVDKNKDPIAGGKCGSSSHTIGSHLWWTGMRYR